MNEVQAVQVSSGPVSAHTTLNTHDTCNREVMGYPCFIREGRGTLFHQTGIGSTPVSFRESGYLVSSNGIPVCSLVCAATQNSEKFEGTTQVLPSVSRAVEKQ